MTDKGFEDASCDLLEKSYFCSIANNPSLYILYKTLVVICLKNRTFAVSQTTCAGSALYTRPLWFAWKIVLLQYRKQQLRPTGLLFPVVICLKNRTFAVSQTTSATGIINDAGLWFAWKIVLLQYRKQQPSFLALSLAVVICLKNRTFAVSQTTQRNNIIGYIALWFAWKIVLLQYRKQQGEFNGAKAVVVICLKNRTFAVSQTTHFLTNSQKN